MIYMPNHPYTSYTNFSTFQLSYTSAESTAFLDNGMHVASGNSSSLPTCLACALIQRAVVRAGGSATVSEQCGACF